MKPLASFRRLFLLWREAGPLVALGMFLVLQQLDERGDALHIRLIDDVGAAQLPFVFTIFVRQDVASTHVVAF